jgi:hypothetical protein
LVFDYFWGEGSEKFLCTSRQRFLRQNAFSMVVAAIVAVSHAMRSDENSLVYHAEKKQ